MRSFVARLRVWWRKHAYEDARNLSSGRHAPRMPKFLPSLAALLVFALLALWLIFVTFARLTVGPDVRYWWPRAGSLPREAVLDIVRSTITLAGVFAGIFAVVYSYRKQRVEEAAGRRADEEGLSKRYQDAASELGDDKPAVRLAGVYAMARLADDWPQQRQTCVDVLCAYIRMHWDTDDKSEADVRSSIFTIMRKHLLEPSDATVGPAFSLIFAMLLYRVLTLERPNF